MRFNDAAQVDQIAYEMRLADYPRSLDRARINDLFNGVPPYTAEEAQKNGIEINVNFLEPTRLAHEARAQMGSVLKPGRFFRCTTDMGAQHKRQARSAFVTSRIAKVMKASGLYYETVRSGFALDVLHGIAPCGWDTTDLWCPDSYGIEDVLVPANTKLTMKNLPFFILYHSYTGPELMKLTRDRDRAKETGWNLGLVDRCIEYLDRETMALTHNQWPEVWSPEKMAERTKGDGGFYAADSVPTIDCFDFYFWNDDDDEEGWCRRIILDSWSTPENAGGIYKMDRNSKTDFGRNQFLFTSGKRKIARHWRNMVTWQFADLSAVAPFNYHSVRSLGYLMYAIGHLQNRLRCRFNEAVWESTLMYLRVRNLDDAERALKVELANRGFIDESVQFVPAAERFQINTPLVQLGLKENQQLIGENASSYMQNAQAMGQDKTERTKFEVQARLQMSMQLLSAAFDQTYRYKTYEYQEIFRRFLLPNSRDPEVQTFRAACLKYGIPENMLVPEAWEVEAERIMGAGNKTLEMLIAEQLMQARNLFDPEPQRAILRDFVQAVTEDPARAEALVPEQPARVTDAVHDAELATGALMMGLPVQLKTGINHLEYVDTLIRNMGLTIQKIEQQQGSNATPEQVMGLQNVAQNMAEHIKIVAQDRNEKARVSAWGKVIAKLMNMVKKYQANLQQQQQQQGPQVDMETQAKVQAMKTVADAKAANTRESHAQRTAQRQLQFEQEMKQKQQEGQTQLRQQNEDLRKTIAELQMALKAKQAEHGMNLRTKQAEHKLDLRKKRTETAIDIAAAREQATIDNSNDE